MSTLGVDTSEFAGIPDYALLREQGAEFAIPRTSAGLSHVDKLVERHLAGLGAAGVQLVAGYHYLYSWRPGAAQADHAHAVMLRLGLPTIYLDLEPVMVGTRETDAPELARVEALAFARRWLDLTGQRCRPYGPVAYLKELHLEPDLFELAWGAHVGKKGSPLAGEPMRLPGFDLAIHQYQHNAPAGGGVVDWNRSAMTVEQLAAALAGRERAPLPYDLLGPNIAAINAAEGRCVASVEDFTFTDEGPVVALRER